MSNGKGLFFNGIPYYAEDMVSYLGSICSDGVMMNEDSLKPVSSGGLNVHINGGTAYIQGYCYVLDDEGCDFTVESGSRTDLIVLQLDLMNKTLQLVLKKNQEEPLENEIGIAKLVVQEETLTITDIRKPSSFKFSLASNVARVITGTYTGDGEASMFVDLGITPKAVVVYSARGQQADAGDYENYVFSGGLALLNYPCHGYGHNILKIVENGFNVFYVSYLKTSNWSSSITTNSGLHYYIAFI